MADLDDFFAKKDRKKKTSKKFATTEEIAKKLEDSAKKSEKAKKERVPEGDESSSQVVEQDEWREFEEEKKDYTGLKIGNLTIDPDQDVATVNSENVSGDQAEGSESASDLEKKAGPWNRMDTQQGDVALEEAPMEKKPEPPAPAASSEGPRAYKPPHLLRSNAAPSASHAPGRNRLGRSFVPDIHNEMSFPTLSKGGESNKNSGEGAFEMVSQNRAASHRQQMEQSKSSTGPKLNLDNRYNTLSNDS